MQGRTELSVLRVSSWRRSGATAIQHPAGDDRDEREQYCQRPDRDELVARRGIITLGLLIICSLRGRRIILASHPLGHSRPPLVIPLDIRLTPVVLAANHDQQHERHEREREDPEPRRIGDWRR